MGVAEPTQFARRHERVAEARRPRHHQRQSRTRSRRPPSTSAHVPSPKRRLELGNASRPEIRPVAYLIAAAWECDPITDDPDYRRTPTLRTRSTRVNLLHDFWHEFLN